MPARASRRQMLMRRAITAINGNLEEIRLRNISAMGALVECSQPVAPGTQLTLDIVGVGPVAGTVRWSQASRFGMQFNEPFDLARLAPSRQKQNDVTDSEAVVRRQGGRGIAGEQIKPLAWTPPAALRRPPWAGP